MLRGWLVSILFVACACGPSPTEPDPQTGGINSGFRGAKPGPPPPVVPDDQSTSLGSVDAEAQTPEDAARARECAELVGAINESIGKVEAIQPGDKELAQKATVMEEAAATLDKMSLSTPHLRHLAKSYAGMARSTAKAARGFDEASAKKDAKAAATHDAALDDTLAKEDDIVDELNRWCGVDDD
jgi:hypothetical protein